MFASHQNHNKFLTTYACKHTKFVHISDKILTKLNSHQPRRTARGQEQKGNKGKKLQLIDDTAEDIDLTADDVTNDEDADMDDDDEDEGPSKRTKTATGSKVAHDHCDVNFVKDTNYYLLASDTKKQWGSATFVDPAPAVPSFRKDSCSPGDYMLIAGKDIVLKSTGSNYTTATFDPCDELILKNTWAQFDDEMTGQDLFDLEDETFLIWWQNVKAPSPPKTKQATIQKKKPKRGR